MSLTRQRIFDKVARHLLTQGEEAYESEGGYCFYRMKRDGKVLKCAAGALISDANYSSGLEGLCVDEFPVSAALRQSGVPHEWLGDVAALLMIHDHCVPASWMEALKEFAEERNLSTEVLNDF